MTASGPRGFSLIEIAVVLAVITALAAVVGVGMQGFARAARAERTATELTSSARAATDYVLRGLDLSLNCTSGGCSTREPLKQFQGVDLLNQPGVCFDLSCAAPPCLWNGVATQAGPAPSDLRLILGDSPASGGAGRNAYDNPYAVCVFRRRVVVATCMPTDDIPSTLSGGAPDDCPGAPWSFTCRAGVERCVSASMVLAPPDLSRVGLTYKYLYWGNATQP